MIKMQDAAAVRHWQWQKASCRRPGSTRYIRIECFLHTWLLAHVGGVIFYLNSPFTPIPPRKPFPPSKPLVLLNTSEIHHQSFINFLLVIHHCTTLLRISGYSLSFLGLWILPVEVLTSLRSFVRYSIYPASKTVWPSQSYLGTSSIHTSCAIDTLDSDIIFLSCEQTLFLDIIPTSDILHFEYEGIGSTFIDTSLLRINLVSRR